MKQEVELYRELIDFCNEHRNEIEKKFKRLLTFTDFNVTCYKEMFWKQRKTSAPISVKELKEQIQGLAEIYKKEVPKCLGRKNEFLKGMDIQKGQWYEKALQMFLATKDIYVKKKGFPFPDFEVLSGNKVVAYYELKYIQIPFIYANTKIQNTYPYATSRYDYESSLTLDTGKKLQLQRTKIENDILPLGIPVYYVWWFDSFHIKGIFAMPVQEVFDYYNHLENDQFTRKTREGDAIAHQEITKIYPPMLNMITFKEFITSLK